MEQYRGYGPEPLKLWLTERSGEEHPWVSHSRESAQRLLQSDDMARAWPELKKKGIESITLRSWIDNARRNAAAEVRSESHADIAASFTKIETLVRQLRNEIRLSQLPAGKGYFVDLQHKGLEPVSLVFGWHGMRDDADQPFQPISLENTLDLALRLIQRERDSLPARAVIRKKSHTQNRGNDAELRAFVVTLGWSIRKNSGTYLYGTLAHIANAIFEPANPLDKKSAQAIIKASPEPFKRNVEGGGKGGKMPP